MKLFLRSLTLAWIIFLLGVQCELSQSFTFLNVTDSNPTRYHALGMFNNDHPSRKRIAVRKCNSFNYIFPVKIFSTEEPFFCPAVFVSTDSLVASALCLKMMQHADEHPTNHMFALVDREDVFFYEHGRRYLSKIFYHPQFEDEPAFYNVAIVKLRNLIYDRDDTGRSHVACLWSERRLKNPQAILGEWFEFQPEQNPSFRWLDLPIVPNKDCSEALANTARPVPELAKGVQDFQLCVRDPRNNTLIRFCDPRSSGPLLMTLGSTVYVIGLPTVHIEDCGVDVEVFNRVTHYLDWIETIVWPGQE
ncbi:serine protease Hayan-like isoform X2 [Toxorhynchites rutilus septentrionalis]|uniref:serine protease Hayan-like isoform X2 n=1 Tax=Toxorhynchites rutilus septentrionalis TaxID=329112 RepID=UPI00247A307F|nr:serine protease Hayan-like isoform X2 [Toxorhynchites rutilus septentrionalis]